MDYDVIVIIRFSRCVRQLLRGMTARCTMAEVMEHGITLTRGVACALDAGLAGGGGTVGGVDHIVAVGAQADVSVDVAADVALAHALAGCVVFRDRWSSSPVWSSPSSLFRAAD